MVLCTAARAISSLPNSKLFTTNQTHLPWKLSLPLSRTSLSRIAPGPLYYFNSSLRSTTSEEMSSEANQLVKEESDGSVTVEEAVSGEKSGFSEIEVVKEETPVDDQFQQFDILDKLNVGVFFFPVYIALDFEDSFPVILLGGGGLVSLWLAIAVVGSIDSIPLFPKLLEIVGLGYTIWFSTRYLLFKKNRDELASKIEEIKQQVLGSKN